MNHIYSQRVLFALALLAASELALNAGAQVRPAQACSALTSLQIKGVALKITAATPTAAGPFAMGPHAKPVDLPEHCVFTAEINPREGVDGKHYGIGFELRLPAQWNGKFFFQGGGGMDGVVRPAVGGMPNWSSTAPAALARGYAVASTDAGHEGQDGSFGKDQQARIDYYYNAIEEVTQVSKLIIETYYGTAAKRSYFVGCSNGGRQALIAAQRFPLMFDGVVSGDPAFNLTNAAVGELWDDATYLAIAPKDAAGQPILSRAFSDADLKLLSDSVLAKCDALDGARDGLIENPKACNYDPAVLLCGGPKNGGCLTREQVAALQKAFAGPHDSARKTLYSDWPYDAGISAPDWRQWKLGSSPTAASNAINITLGPEATRSIHMDTYQPPIDPRTYNFDAEPGKSASVAGFENATYTAMTSFRQRGGKLILFTGLSDPIFSANDLVRYYEKIAADNGGAQATMDWARLYLFPGMTHCGGGPSLDDFDPLAALENWVEKNQPPDTMPARGPSFPGRSRNICAYPAYPHYNGSGSVDDAKSFTCKSN
jgi:feruloyl esterase